MRILVALTYYRPHVSGLTIYVERLAKALVRRGHTVTVMTSRYDRGLPSQEVLEGVQIIRVPVAFRVSKGVIMPTIGLEATRRVLAHDVLSLHLPQLDAAGIALRGRLLGKPTLLTYHSDLRLPPGPVNSLANFVVDRANDLAAQFSHAIIAYTEDFARHSPFLSRFGAKVRVIPPPVEVTAASSEIRARFAAHGQAGQPRIGMAARLATEKGVEYLLQALPEVLNRYPGAHVLFAGQHENVLGERAYKERLAPLLDRHRDRWTFLGVLEPAEMTGFFEVCDVTVLPSVNSTETFGLVQIESMICGTPVVASELPGVRQPVKMTGMGELVPIRDSDALAAALLQVLGNPQDYRRNPDEIRRSFAPDTVAEHYESVYQALL